MNYFYINHINFFVLFKIDERGEPMVMLNPSKGILKVLEESKKFIHN